jgi:hypothetical protein
MATATPPERWRARGETPRPRSLTAVLAVAAMLVVAVGAAGCGSSSKPALTKAQLLAKGNAICTEGNNKLTGAQKTLGENPSKAQITTYVTGTFVPSIQGQIDAIRALGAPSGEEATVTHMLDVAQEDLNKVKSNPLLLASGPGTFANFAALAHPYGLTECARNA